MGRVAEKGVAAREWQEMAEMFAFPVSNMGIVLSRFLFRQRFALCVFSAGLVFASFSSLGRGEDAVSALREKIDQAEKERAEICKILGAIYEETGDSEKAIESYRLGFQVFPDDPLLCNKLIELCTAEERWGELVPIYQSLVNANPGANEAYMRMLAECHLKARQNEEAVAVLAEMLDEYGVDVADYRDAAQMLMAYEQYEAAASVCRRGIEGEVDEGPDLHYLLGRAWAKGGKYREAIVAYKKALELCTSQQETRILEEELANLCMEQPIIERILEENTESLKGIDERLAELYWRKAAQEQQDGDANAALALYRKIVSLVPGSEKAEAAEKKIRELSNP